MNGRQSNLPGFKTLTLGLAMTMPMSPYWHMRWPLSNPVKSLPERSLGHLWLISTTSSVVRTTIDFRPLNGKLLSALVWVFPLRFSLALGPAQQYTCNDFAYDTFGDHLQTCQTKSASSQVHDWVVYKLGTLLGSVGHRVKIHMFTSLFYCHSKMSVVHLIGHTT